MGVRCTAGHTLVSVVGKPVGTPGLPLGPPGKCVAFLMSSQQPGAPVPLAAGRLNSRCSQVTPGTQTEAQQTSCCLVVHWV